MKEIKEGELPPDEIYVYIRKTKENTEGFSKHRAYSALRVMLPEQIRLDKEYFVYKLVGRVKSVERIRPEIEPIPSPKSKRARPHPRAVPYGK
jgi:hypothetical protein